MSPDHEDTALEEALRDDLPSPETSARLRRRLVAAGIAVGNGMAVTSVAAAGTTPGLVAGMVSKGLALSWGVKLGVLAVVAIPTVGLVVESSADPQLSAPPASAAALAPARSPERAADALAAPAPQEVTSPDSESPSPPRVVAPNARLTAPGSEPPPEAGASRPSQVDFAAPESAAAARAASTLAEETRILDKAFAELAAGKAAQAAQLIAEHERRFPAGLLQKERERAKARYAEISRGE